MFPGWVENYRKGFQAVKRFTCTECSRCFDKRVSLTSHMKTKHKIFHDLTCHKCNITFKTITTFEKHIAKHGEPQFQCEECETLFYTEYNRLQHMKRIHFAEDSNKHKCTLCPRSFVNLGSLEAHINSHTGAKPYICDKCGKGFQNPSNLRTHAFKEHKDFKERDIFDPVTYSQEFFCQKKGSIFF